MSDAAFHVLVQSQVDFGCVSNAHFQTESLGEGGKLDKESIRNLLRQQFFTQFFEPNIDPTHERQLSCVCSVVQAWIMSVVKVDTLFEVNTFTLTSRLDIMESKGAQGSVPLSTPEETSLNIVANDEECDLRLAEEAEVRNDFSFFPTMLNSATVFKLRL